MSARPKIDPARLADAETFTPADIIGHAALASLKLPRLPLGPWFTTTLMRPAPKLTGRPKEVQLSNLDFFKSTPSKQSEPS